MARDFSSPVYQRIAAWFAEKIDRGDLTHGEKLPTRQQLAEQYQVSLQVVRDALALLHTDGYVRSIPSKGTFVYRLPRLVWPMLDFEADRREQDAFYAIVEDQEHEPSHTIKVETVLAGDQSVPPGLELDDNDRVVARRRLRSVDGIPYAISDSFYPQDLVRDSELTSPEDIRRGARHVLRELGLEMVHHHDVIESRRAHNNEVSMLDIAPGVAVIAHTRVSFTREGRPMRVLASVLPSDRWNVTYKVGA